MSIRDAVSRRALLAGLCGASVGGLALAAGDMPAAGLAVRIDDQAAGTPISPYIYGSNEIGTMDGNGPSVDFDRSAGVTVRRLGGNLMTPYNWLDNATNAGKDYRHANGAFLLETLGVAKENWGEPAAVVEAFLDNSRSVGARSLLALPLAGFVAADFDGEVSEAQAAPSSRFRPIDWSERPQPGAVGIPALLKRLVARHGGAASGGIAGYYLDNEPALWPETHPRIVKAPVTIRSLIERSLRAAAAIKAADADALVMGPASWGSPEFVNFRNAPDWAAYRRYGSFLGAYLDAFRRESERVGRRLLDALDVHWYPFSRRGDLFRSEDARLAGALLDAPRSFDEAGFCEESWVADSLGCRPRAGVYLPLLPSLKGVVDANYPGTALSFGEFNFGGAGSVASGLAVADALGRFGRFGVGYATHWGSLAGFVGEAYRLYRQRDGAGERFGEAALPVAGGGPTLSVFAARGQGPGRLGLVAINKAATPVAFDLALASGRAPSPLEIWGFDASNAHVARIEGETLAAGGGAARVVVPARAARRFRLS